MPEAVKSFRAKALQPSGRASRSEYWWSWLAVMIVAWTVTLLSPQGSASLAITFGILIGLTIPLVMSAIRRLHDTGKPGVWLLLVFIPLVGPLILIVLLLLPPDPHPNQWG